MICVGQVGPVFVSCEPFGYLSPPGRFAVSLSATLTSALLVGVPKQDKIGQQANFLTCVYTCFILKRYVHFNPGSGAGYRLYFRTDATTLPHTLFV